MRVLGTLIPTGETNSNHARRSPPNVQYVVSGADFVRRDGDGKVTLDTRAGSGTAEALDRVVVPFDAAALPQTW